ncbi:iron transporter [Fusobacterium russii]|uniref:iron transporter n=1 Tax=Fusobacterium russii TaxID=854 RepID=UPI0003A9DA7B|nr:iron transporter [Fusobacterium russii]
MKNLKFLATAFVVAGLSFGLVACGEKKEEAKPATEQPVAQETTTETKEAGKPAEAPGESGFVEIPIDETIVGPYQVAAVYFQGVDMIPEGKQPTAAESDMHLEADIHLTPEAAVAYGFGDGDSIWPAYLTVNYKVLSEDKSKEITSGSFMPMNADDGAHYGINIKKGLIPVGKYVLQLEIKAPTDYLLHVDSETGVPAARENGVAAAEEFFKTQSVEFDWVYTGEQLQNK